MRVKMQKDPDGKIRPKLLPWTPEQTKAHFDLHFVSVKGCWIWNGCTDDHGYGIIKFKGKNIGAHRYSAIINHGPPPHHRALACHKCDQPLCVNPEHIYWGTHKRNTQDMIERGRAKHSVGESLSYSKLTNALVAKVRELRGEGISFRKIASIIGVSKTTVQGVIYGHTWTHVK